MRNITILGSTGSIGRSALDVISGYPDRFRVVGLTANRNLDLLAEQIDRFSPDVVGVPDEDSAAVLRTRTGVPVLSGQEGLCGVASHGDADFVLSAIVGAAGLVPTMAAVRAGKTVGLANKETLVVAGDLVMAEAAKSGARILPVDSEHSAVFQCIGNGGAEFVRKIIITASGGPFVGMRRSQLEHVTQAEALNHPKWTMGRKITVDSATLMNKGLEVIEAHYLFGLPPEKIEVVVHPQSIIHSIVEFVDGCALAQMSVPDMKAAIAYALSYPARLGGVVPSLDLPALGELRFLRPDTENFPCLSYAYEALSYGGTMPAVLNAANEVAVESFLDGLIGFNDIPSVIRSTLDSYDNRKASSLDDVLAAHSWAIKTARGLIEARAAN